MTSAPEPVDFDQRPPMRVGEYAETVRRVNVGYDLLFTLTRCIVQGLGRADLNLLVVGAGGGQELEILLPHQPTWRITGVDPSAAMLALAQAKAEQLGIEDQVTLIQGTVDDLPSERRFDAAICHFVLHFLPDAQKVALLQGIAARLRPDAPLIVASGARGADVASLEEVRPAWQQYGELMGMPAEQMAATLDRLLSQPNITSDAEYVQLLQQAGFRQVMCFFSALGVISAWIAR